MSGYQNSSWINRLWALARPGDPVTPHVSNVQIVSDRRYASSRERAPYASHGGLIAGAGAGVHNFVEVGGLDSLAPTLNLLHYARFELGQANQLTGALMIALADGAALTTASRTAVTPMFRDLEEAAPRVSTVLFEGTITTANLPATVEVLPKSVSLGQTNATPAYPSAVTELPPLEGLPFAASWLGPRNLILFSGADETLAYWIAWQAQRQ